MECTPALYEQCPFNNQKSQPVWGQWACDCGCSGARFPFAAGCACRLYSRVVGMGQHSIVD